MNGSAVPGTRSPAETHSVADTLAGLPQGSGALFGADPFSTLAWYRATEAEAMPVGGRPAFHCIGDPPDAIFPMMEQAGQLSCLSTPYTVLWQPLLAPGLPAQALQRVGKIFGRACRTRATVRLDTMDAHAAWTAPLAAGLRRAGLRVLPFDHVGNWHCDLAGGGWPAYVASRPGALREAIRRRGRRLKQLGAVLDIVSGGDGLEAAIAAFEAVYARSWKDPEPSPLFNANLMRQCAVDGSLRLGILRLGGASLAAQFWVVHAGTAFVLKLAHDEAQKALSPGTVLTAFMIERLIEHDHVRSLDFGRGDDPYKQLWTDSRRQRIGWVLANPRTAQGLAAIARFHARRLLFAARRVTWRPRITRSQ